MPDCECLKDCPYFENEVMKEIDVMAKIRQEQYCRGDYSQCARYIVFKALGKANVPRNLLPFQADKAKALIASSGK